MASLNGQVPSDVEESRINPDTEELRSGEEALKWLDRLTFSAPPSIGGITVYQHLQNIQNSNANRLHHAASLLMGFSFIFAFIILMLANIVTGRQGFLIKHIKLVAISVTLLEVVAVVLAIVAGFF